MTKIFKASEVLDKDVADFCTVELEEEPVPGTEGFAGGEEEPEELDPAALRESVLAEAREEARIKVEEAYAKGLERGREAGETEFRASIAEAAQCIESAAAAMRAAREEFINGLEEQVVEMAALIAQRVLGREVRADTNLVNAAVRRGLAVLTDRQKLRVRINPADLDALDAHKVSLLHDFAGIGTLDIEADASIKAGGCYVTSETMEADVTLETLLAEVLDTLAE